MPEPHEFLSARQHKGTTLEAGGIYRETWEWLDKPGAAITVPPANNQQTEKSLHHSRC